MPIDVGTIKERIEDFRSSDSAYFDDFVAPTDVEELLAEIEQLRAQVAKLERYKADFWKAYAEDEKKRQMRGDVDA